VKGRFCRGATALLLSSCAVYDSGLVDRARDGGTAPVGSSGGENQPGTTGGGQGSTGGSNTVGSGGDIVASGGSGGSSNVESGGAAGSAGANGSAGASGGMGGSGGAGGGSAADLAIFRDGTFVAGWGTVGSWNTCNGTPISAKIDTSTALAIDLSCNSYNGALLINWNAPVPSCTYETLSFDIYFADIADISALKVHLESSQGALGLLISVAPLITLPQGKSFNHVSLPIASFGQGIVYNGIGLFNGSACGIPLFYVNNVVLGAGPGACADGGA